MGFSLAFKIAWRNLWRHKGKSLVIGVILLFGSVLMTVGNGMISGTENGLSQNIVNLFTGDIVIVSDQQEKNNVLFDFSGKPLKVIKNYDAAKKTLDSEDIIQDYLPATAGAVYVLSGADMYPMYLLGVDIEKYRKIFPESIKITEGRMLKPQEKGILVTGESRKQAYDFANIWLLPDGTALDKKKLPKEVLEGLKDLDVRKDLVFIGASTSNSTLDIRVPITGIVDFKALNKIWGNYCIVDIESFREAHNYVTGADSNVKISSAEKKLLESDQLDQFFSSENVIENAGVSQGNSISIQDIQAQTKKQTSKYSVDAGSYNIAFVKLKKGVSQQKALRSLNETFKKNHLNVRAVSWKDSVGTIGSMAAMIKVALNIFIIFIFFVAIIVIMNTLSMAALERVTEIGMMRAIGARKGFLRKMFIYETGILSFFFGGLGIIIGIIIIYGLKSANITTTNEFLQLVYGGDKLNPIYTAGDFILGIFELGIVTILSVIYPLRVVDKIVPLDAITRE